MDCSRASDAERVCDCDKGVQWPNDKKPMCFTPVTTPHRPSLFLGPGHPGGSLRRWQNGIILRYDSGGRGHLSEEDHGMARIFINVLRGADDPNSIVGRRHDSTSRGVGGVGA
jgi:hypothetical protein